MREMTPTTDLPNSDEWVALKEWAQANADTLRACDGWAWVSVALTSNELRGHPALPLRRLTELLVLPTVQDEVAYRAGVAWHRADYYEGVAHGRATCGHKG